MINGHVAVYLVISVFILWKTILWMVGKKNIAVFFPFFLVGVILCFKAAILFYLPLVPSAQEIQFVQIGLVIARLLLSGSLIWIFVIIRRKNGRN
jgi:hypothetical protein